MLQKRLRMVEEQIASRGVSDTRVLEAMRKVKRHFFLPAVLQPVAYADEPLPIGHGQTISQPYIVAYMTEALRLKPQDRVLEIGTGSGYQSAVLAEIVKEVYTVELVDSLVETARDRLDLLGYRNIYVRRSDGYSGWPDKAPFDAIMVTAAPPEVPEELVNQLCIGGMMIVPVGQFFQELRLIKRTPSGFESTPLLPVRFVPMRHPGKSD